MPADLDVIIGWEVTSKLNLRLEKGAACLDLCHDLTNTPKVLTIKESNSFDNLKVKGLADQELSKLKALLIRTRKMQRADVV